MHDGQALPPQEQKLFALARAARARVEAPAGAAVVDETGRTYSAAQVELPHLRLTALSLAVAVAAAAGARQLASAVIVSADPGPGAGDRDAFADLAAAGGTIIVCRPDGTQLARWSAP